MSTFWSVLLFMVLGALIGYLGTLMFKGVSLVVSIILGLVGSLGISWVAKLLGLGAGFVSFSVWGVVFGILGACLAVGIYGLIARKSG